MATLLFSLYSLAHFATVVFALRILRRYSAPGALIIAVLSAGLVYDNSLIALGSSIGIGETLERLSWPRFILHALVTPFMIVAVVQIAIAGGIRWLSTRAAWTGVWLLTAAMIGYGIYELTLLELQPACFGGITRYTSSASAAQFCFEGQQSLPGTGPPIPSILAVFLVMGVGVALWRRHRWPWYGLGGLQMLLAAAVPFSDFGLLPGNGGEVILQFAFVSTAYRLSSGWRHARE
ncbi:MAG: hypothetical protein QNJ73_10030 [Gammaproteobacteria bacterium]|nr:hypothetical protein [Gammaproteobacteria bacterium]